MQKMIKVSGDTGKIGDVIDVVRYNGELDSQFLQALTNHPHGFTYGLPCIYHGTLAIGMKIDGKPEEVKIQKGEYLGFCVKDGEHDALFVAPADVVEREYVLAHTLTADHPSFDETNKRFIEKVHAPAYEVLTRETHLAEALSTDQPMTFTSEPVTQENYEAAASQFANERKHFVRFGEEPKMEVYTHRPLQVHAVHYVGGRENQEEIVALLGRHGFNAGITANDITIFLEELVMVEPGQVIVLEGKKAWTTTLEHFLERYEIVSR